MASSALDHAALQYAEQGKHVLSTQRGAWTGRGVAAQERITVARVERMGMHLIQPEMDLMTLLAILRYSVCDGSAIVYFNWPKFAAANQNLTAAIFSENVAHVDIPQ